MLLLIWMAFQITESLGQSVKVPHYRADTIVGYYELTYTAVDSSGNNIVKAIYPSDSTVGLKKLYRNGQMNGLMEIYHPNGKIHIRAFYAQGKLNGVWEEWSREGDLIIKCYYIDGVRDGRWSHIPESHRGKYKNGRKHGRWKLERDGKRYIRRYSNGDLKYERRGFWFR